MDKQQEKELAIFRLMGERCAEKMHRSNSVLLNGLRRKLAAAIVLQQAETGCAMEHELFQSQHASILEHGVTAQQSLSSSNQNSMQVNTPPRRARMPEDVVATVRPRLGMCARISVLCKRDVAEIDWEKLVKAERESELKRMLEFELCEKVSEELTSGKRIWNSAWLDSQEKSGVARSAPAENQISGACQGDDVFAGKRKIMRKDETTWKLLKATHGTQVASLRWQRLGRGTLCEDRWKVLVCWVQRDRRLVGGVSWRRDNNIVNNSWSVDTWRSLAGDVVGDAGSQRLVIMRVRMPWKGIRSSEGIFDELYLPQR